MKLFIGLIFVLLQLGCAPIPIEDPNRLIPIKRVPPYYPIEALRAGIESTVWVQFDILQSGAVTNVTVVQSSNNKYKRLFERNAIESVSQFIYETTIDGEIHYYYDVVRKVSFRIEAPPTRRGSRIKIR